MREQFINKRFRQSSLVMIMQALKIIEEWQEKGFVLNLRQLYYQFVARGHIENSVKSYKKLGVIVSDARLSGLIDWDSIEDLTRNLQGVPHWRNPESIIESAADGYRIDKWVDQEYRVEVWVEKEALSGVVQGVCEELDVDYFACRGYVSQSAQWAAGKRYQRYNRLGQEVVLLHLGDHDPSGIDMSRDNSSRLEMFSRSGLLQLKRLALNYDQVEEYDPPPNPAKTTDTRYEVYRNKYGEDSWELDALDPTVIQELIRAAVLDHRDDDLVG